ncbi:MAG: hypothetical protein HQL73_00935 [Magnetococcales bacterium]|nr:hypothetical protein [Magnetococcales bacterium]
MIVQKTSHDHLKQIYQQLNDTNRDALLKFARFLLQDQETAPRAALPQEPVPIVPMPGENVIQALKRLKKTYPMIDADMRLLDAASQCVMQKVLGHPDAVLIVKMERLFRDAYEQWRRQTEMQA